MDIVPTVAKLNLFFQKEITDVALVKVYILFTNTCSNYLNIII